MTHAEIIEHLRRVAEEKASKDSRLSIPSEFLEGIAADAIIDLEARLRIAERRAEDAESRNEFLMTELDKLIEKARQS